MKPTTETAGSSILVTFNSVCSIRLHLTRCTSITWALVLAMLLILNAENCWAIAITSSATAPSTGSGSGIREFQQTANGNATGKMIYTADSGNDTHWVSGQIFQSQANYNVDKYVLQIQSGASALQNAPVKISLYNHSSGAQVGPTGGIGNAIQTDLGMMPATLANNDYITFDVSNQALTSGGFYSFAVDFQSAAAGQTANWAVQGANGSYGAGQMWDFNERDTANGGLPEYDSIADDMLFYVFDDSGAPPPPSLPILTPNATRTETFPNAGGHEFVNVNSPHTTGQNFGFSNTNFSGSTAGEAGGTFARSLTADAFADIDLTDGNQGDFDRTQTLKLSGNFSPNGSFDPDGNVFVGYMNDDIGVGTDQFIGLAIFEAGGNDFRIQAWIQSSASVRSGSSIFFISAPGDYTFDLTYVGNPDGSGTLSGTIAGNAVTVFAGPSTARFDKFGIGSGFSGNDDASKTMDIFFDNLTYSIYVTPVPEPSSLGMVMAGIIAMVASVRCRRGRRGDGVVA